MSEEVRPTQHASTASTANTTTSKTDPAVSDPSAAPAAAVAAPTGYHEGMIRVLDDVEHVRTRPGMYIGGTTPVAYTIWCTKSSTTASTKPAPASRTPSM